MKLCKLIDGTTASILAGDAQTEIQSICLDSRKACPGSLFIAVKGTAADGAQFLQNAMDAGAVAAVSADRKTLAILADRFYDHPSGKLSLVGITGTNGKTTTVTLLYKLFRSLGYECGLLSTIANFVGSKEYPTENTTADPITINSLLDQMVKAGCEYCFMEVSSIGVEQDRIYGLEFRIAMFSNLTHDHLDYHGTFAEYLRCKKLFFDSLPKSAVAIINADDRNASVMVQNCKARVVRTSVRSLADHSCKILEQSMEGTLLQIDGVQVWSRLVGVHNVYNLLAIYSAAVEMGSEVSETLVALSNLSSAPGRLETIPGPDGKTIVIDYAHTPDALENVLKTLKDICSAQKLVCVFGCGGDRDRSKRPEMAAVAEKYSDRIIVTSDNPRTEEPDAIIREICTGFSAQAMSKTMCITDREQAIRAAVLFSEPKSVILLAGKGHETYQIIGKTKNHFDEHEVVAKIIA